MAVIRWIVWWPQRIWLLSSGPHLVFVEAPPGQWTGLSGCALGFGQLPGSHTWEIDWFIHSHGWSSMNSLYLLGSCKSNCCHFSYGRLDAKIDHYTLVSFQAAEIPSAEEFNLYSFDFNDLPQSDMETVYSVIRMFLDCKIPSTFHVPYDVSTIK